MAINNIPDRGIADEAVAVPYTVKWQNTPDPKVPAVLDTDLMVADQLKYTGQTFPPPMNAGAFLIGEASRGPILPQYGTKERERILRLYDHYEYNGIWQGAITGLIKKIATSPWELTGDSQWAPFFQAMLQSAHFGQGWSVFLKRLLRDYLTQDYGAFIELIGPGYHDTPLNGPVVGIAHLDSGRCFVTGNPTWPVVYYSLYTGALHKYHHSRIIRMVDQPNPDERYFGIGLCALSRCIGAANREIRMGRYIDAYLDDKPKPGITAISGISKNQFATLAKDYNDRQGVDDGNIFGKALMMFSLDTDKKVEVQEVPFAQTPSKFDFIKYTDLDVNSVALGLGVDKLELWELGGRMLGSAQQSNVMAQKAEGKAFGDIIQTLEQITNNHILPIGCEMHFKTRNTIVDDAQAKIDLQLSQIVHTIAQIPETITGNEVRTYLVNSSDRFASVFRKDRGEILLTDSDIKLPRQETHLDDVPPPQATLNKPIVMTTGAGQGGGGGFGNSTTAQKTSVGRKGRLANTVGKNSDVRKEVIKLYMEGKSKAGSENDLSPVDVSNIQYLTVQSLMDGLDRQFVKQKGYDAAVLA